jgi:hypothetical protein
MSGRRCFHPLVIVPVLLSVLAAQLRSQICQEHRTADRPCSVETFGLLAEGEAITMAMAGLLGLPTSFTVFVDAGLAMEYFRPACQRHYECYRYGPQTYGRDRGDCDDNLYTDMTRICAARSGIDRDICFLHRDLIHGLIVFKGKDHFLGTPFWDPERTGPYCEYAGPGRNYHVPDLPEVAQLLFQAGALTAQQRDRIGDLVARYTDPDGYDRCGATIAECTQAGVEPLLSEAALHYQLLETIDPGLLESLRARAPGCEVHVVYELVPVTPSGPGYVAVERISECDDLRGYQFDWRTAFLSRWERLLDCRLGPDDDGDGISNGCDHCPRYADPSNRCAFVDANQAVVEDSNWARGAAWGDYDGDGDLDLYLTSNEPRASVATPPTTAIPRLYRNRGDGTLQNVTATSGYLGSETLINPAEPMWVDYDDDGRLDLYVGVSHELIHNDGDGTFSDATPVLPPRLVGETPWFSAVWIDVDHDGFLDVHFFRLGSLSSSLFRNVRGTGFDDISNLVPATTGAIAWVDVDADGDLDLYASQEDRLHRNLGDLQFSAAETLGFDRQGTWGDVDSDGDLDVFVTAASASGRNAQILRNDLGVFVDISSNVVPGLLDPEASWIDFDNDGLLDLYIDEAQIPNELLRNLGQGDFARAANDLIGNSGKCGPVAWGDYNGDGFLDAYQANRYCAGSQIPANPAVENRLLRNTLPARPEPNHWLQVDLMGTLSNSHGVGSRILLHQRNGRDAYGDTVNRTQVRYVMATSRQSLRADFGLGPVAGEVDLEVLWPSGIVQVLEDVQLDRRIEVTEPAQRIFPTPLRIDIGGRHKVDSLGRLWLGDVTPLDNDPLRIRPDSGGGNTSDRGWLEANFHPESIADLGFDPTSQVDRSIFTSMRVDQNTTDGRDFILEVPIENGLYLVNLYICDNETDRRRFKVQIQGDMVDADVGIGDYSPNHPVRGWAGRLQYAGVEVTGGMLRVVLLSCPAAECPGGLVERPLLNALEVVAMPRVGPPGTVTGLAGRSSGGGVQLTWRGSSDPGVAGYRVHRAPDRPGGVLVPLHEGIVESLSYLDATAEVGTAYRYRVSAVNVLSVEGPLSAPLSITHEVPFEITNIRVSPQSPGCMPRSVDVTFDYDVREPVRVKAVPRTTARFRADPSPEYPAGAGTGSASFVLSTRGPDILMILLQVVSPDLSEVLLEIPVPVAYRNQCRRFRRGDVNGSGAMDLSDGVAVFSYLFLGAAEPACLESADSNNSGAIDISDGIAILDFLFLGGTPPPAPGHQSCGTDPDEPDSPGDLGCGAYESC